MQFPFRVEALVKTVIVLLCFHRARRTDDDVAHNSMNDQVFPLAEVASAFKVSMGGKVQGKLGITVV